MKKLMLLALLPLMVGCSKSPNVAVSTVTPAKSAAMKKTPTAVSFSSTANLTGYTSPNVLDIYTGGYTGATGLLNATGTTYELVSVTWPSGGSANAQANATYTFSSQLTLTDASGTITLQLNGSWWITGATTGAGSGNWQVISGTGGYNKVTGSGTVNLTEIKFGPTGAYEVSDTYTGTLYY